MQRFLACLLILGSHYAWADDTQGSAESLPDVQVSNVRRVFHNGEHNAFTDLMEFQGKYYLTFRSCPDGHMVHPTASVIVLSSTDFKTWNQVFRFQVPLRDTRDPHFLVFKEKLFVYTGTWYSGKTTIPVAGYDLNKHLGFCVWSENGNTWHGPQLLEGTFGHYVWRAASCGDKAYLCGRRKIGFEEGPRGEQREVESLMLESDDGLIWKKRAVFQEIDGDETAFMFQPDGALLGIGRRGRDNAQLLRSEAPWTDWSRVSLDRYVGGPLIMQWGSRIVVGGRNTMDKQGPRTSLCWLVGDTLTEFASLPSGGDNSYPGMIPLSETKAVVSWYSSHEIDDAGKPITAIYMADLEIRTDPR